MDKLQDIDRPLDNFNYYIIMWDNYGLESVVDIGRIYREGEAKEAQDMWDILSSAVRTKSVSKATQLGSIINPMLLRARVNNQRHYEIYSVRTQAEISADDITQMFETSPQSAAESIRKLGVKMFSNRADPNRRQAVIL